MAVGSPDREVEVRPPRRKEAMAIRFIGENPLSRDESGAPRCRIGTVFPRSRTVVTLPGIHATQRMAYIDAVNEERKRLGRPPLSEQEQLEEWEDSVDLILQDDLILIRPNPQNMAIAFEADELLQEFVPKSRIKFLHVRNTAVRQAIKQRGECWRISPLPRCPEEMSRLIACSRIAISGRPIYYYNNATGTRFLTYQDFTCLAMLSDDELRAHLIEISELLGRYNRTGHAEVELFEADNRISPADFAQQAFREMNADQLRQIHRALAKKFQAAVAGEFQHDDLGDPQWRNRMCAALTSQGEEAVSEEAMLGLSSEFHMQIEWVPGGRIEQGELIFDTELELKASDRRPRDQRPRGFIFNFLREYGDIEYINIGRVIGSLSRRRPAPSTAAGGRGVYIVEVKLRGEPKEMVRIIRMQKWSVREHLNEGKPLLDSIVETEDYTEYTLDRRLGCRQLGMNLPARLTARKIEEIYDGPRKELIGTPIWSPYFERDYIRGVATDKIPLWKFDDESFAARFARMLGRAAAPNIIVGRCDSGGHAIFDDGDEVVLENAGNGTEELVVTDHTGTFTDYLGDLFRLAEEYAQPVRSRASGLRDAGQFAEIYIASFIGRFREVQEEYRKRWHAFDMLFSHRRRDEGGSFAYRWERILRRLDATDATALGEAIRAKCGL